MDFFQYQNAAHEFATYGNNPMYPALGLAEEAGEVCGKIAKYIRKHDGAEPVDVRRTASAKLTEKEVRDMIEFRDNLEKELGDVLWMVAELCSTHGLTMTRVALNNIKKLNDRKNRGVIVGEGDNR